MNTDNSIIIVKNGDLAFLVIDQACQVIFPRSETSSLWSLRAFGQCQGASICGRLEQ